MFPHMREPPELISLQDQFLVALVFFPVPGQEVAPGKPKIILKTFNMLLQPILGLHQGRDVRFG